MFYPQICQTIVIGFEYSLRTGHLFQRASQLLWYTCVTCSTWRQTSVKNSPRWMLKLSYGRNKEKERENPCKLLAWCYLLWFREFMMSISLMTCFLSVGRHLMNLAAYSMFVLFSIHFFTTPNFPAIENIKDIQFNVRFVVFMMNTVTYSVVRKNRYGSWCGAQNS